MGRYRRNGDKKRVNTHRYAVAFRCLTFGANGRFGSKAVCRERQVWAPEGQQWSRVFVEEGLSEGSVYEL